MKNFNKTISIEIEVDMIAQLLLDNMKEDFKHKEIVVESIIGGAVSQQKLNILGDIYNALNGHTKTINFAVNDYVMCSYETYYDNKSQPIGNAVVIDIDVYKTDQLHVQWIKEDGTTTQRWVNKSTCTLIPMTTGEVTNY